MGFTGREGGVTSKDKTVYDFGCKIYSLLCFKVPA